MKKSLFLTTTAIAALTLAGCREIEPAMGLGDNGAIAFAPYVSRDVAKASVTDVTASNLTSFNVACYQTGSAASYFTSEQSASKNVSEYWETEDTYYWPTSAGLDFFAYSGSGSGSVSNTGGVAKVAYTVPDSGNEDFIVASAINQGKPSASPYAQCLNFSHALSKVSQITLAPKAEDVSANSKYKYIVTDVRIAGAKNSADYTFNPASGSNWGTASGSQDYAFEDKSFNFLGSSSHTLEAGTDVNDQLIVLPQTATFSVTYSVEYSGDDGTTWTEIMPSATKTADVEMEAGKAYTVNLRLPSDASSIIFSSSVSEWNDAEEVDKEVLTPVFSVSASKKVRFTKGNLYWDGEAFHLERSQTAYPEVWDTNYVGHFYWTKTAAASYALSYSDGTCTASDVPFFAESKGGLTVDGRSGLYVLSVDEWKYLINTRSVNGGKGEGKSYQRATVNSVYGLIIYPDNYTAQKSATSYGSSSWKTMEKLGCVFLPAAGYRHGSTLVQTSVDFNRYPLSQYWSSTPYSDKDYVLYLFFSTFTVAPTSTTYRADGQSVRLVYDAQ